VGPQSEAGRERRIHFERHSNGFEQSSVAKDEN